MTLSSLLQAASVVPEALRGDAELASVTSDSRNATPGSLFVCVPSDSQDSHQYIGEAIARGSVAVLTHSREGFEQASRLDCAAAWVRNENSEFADSLWKIAKEFYGNPSRDLKLIGVTGTNGKTTTAWILRQMLGQESAYIGTLGFYTPSGGRPLSNTTPFTLDLNEMIAEAKSEGVSAVTLEVSSHALHQHRADGLEFDAGIFTNLTQDHLDFHGDMASYEAAKYRLFADLGSNSFKPFIAVLNSDDPVGAKWSQNLKLPLLTYGFASGDLRATPRGVYLDRLSMDLQYRGDRVLASAKLGGQFNLWNCLSAVAGLVSVGFTLSEAAERLEWAKPAPGRFEAVPNTAGFGILIDYAHTPDAIAKLLESVAAIGHKRVITVFGCGGDRDRTKRPLMASAASRRSDVVIVTSDNPRTEDPDQILNDVGAGLDDGKEHYLILDRQEAIHKAISLASSGDAVVVAGKGHENYQIVGKSRLKFDDREAVMNALAVRR